MSKINIIFTAYNYDLKKYFHLILICLLFQITSSSSNADELSEIFPVIFDDPSLDIINSDVDSVIESSSKVNSNGKIDKMYQSPNLYHSLNDRSFDIGYIGSKLIAYLSLIIVIIILFSFLIKKFSIKPLGLDKDMRILSSLSLGGKERVVLFQLGDKQILVGVAPGRVTPITTLSQDILSDQKSNYDFSQHLEKMLSKS